jgi:pimeloyl-ACP methyl ester carboxylesterase
VRLRPIPLAAPVLLSLVLLGACGHDGPKVVESSSGEPPIAWKPLGDDRSLEEGRLTVPMDYADPSKGSFELHLVRHLASDPARRIGSLLVNPGGPGFGGTVLAQFAEQIYGPDLLARFDIVAWDPRGTGESTPFIDCVDEYDPYFAGTDITPDDDAERQQLIDVAREFQEACATKNATILPYIGTNNSARDMNSIREALGEATISYFGFSYGSELGATWATLFPDTVRAAVLDGASDPNAGFFDSGLQQAAGFERTLDTFLAKCSASTNCAFHHDGDAEGAFDRLMQALDDKPVPSVSGRPDVTRGVALTAVANAMYSESLWPDLEQALADAEQGDGAGLLSLYDQYFQRRPDGTYDNSLEAFQSIYCMDEPERPTIEEEDASAADAQRVAPRYAPGTTGSYFCTFFPPSIDPRVTITGKGAGPILVMGTTGDPATPLESTRAMAKALEGGRLVIVEADQHTGYGVNQCSIDVVDQYLVDPVGKVPADGTRCR